MIISSSHKKSIFDAIGIKNHWFALSLSFYFILFANSIIGQTTLFGPQTFATFPPTNWSTQLVSGTNWARSTSDGACTSSDNAQLAMSSVSWLFTESFSGTLNRLYYLSYADKNTGAAGNAIEIYVGSGTTKSSANIISSDLRTAATISGSSYASPNVVSSMWTCTATSSDYWFAIKVTTLAVSTVRLDCIRAIEVNPVNYYSKSTGNLEVLSNWGTNTDGTGTAPSNFTSAYQTFNIRNNASPTVGAAWTVSGTNSKIVVGDGTNACDFTIPASFAVTGTVDVANNGTLSIAHLTTNPTLGTLASGSTVDYKGAGAQTIASGSYQNLKLSTSGAKTLISGVTSIAGNLTTSGTATTATVVGLTIGGNLIVGDGTTFTAAGFALTVTGTTTLGTGTSGTLTISSATGTKIFTGLVTVSAGSNWNNSGNSPITFRGGITKLGVSTFTSGSAAQTFSTNNQTLTGALTISSLTISSVTLTASNNLTVSTLTTDASAVLDMGTSSTLTVTTASANSGKVKTSVPTSTSATPFQPEFLGEEP
jgi:hypothetical protein